MSGGNAFEKDWAAEKRDQAERRDAERIRHNEKVAAEVETLERQIDALIGRVFNSPNNADSRSKIRAWANSESKKPYKRAKEDSVCSEYF